MPQPCRRAAVAAPTPQIRSTGNGCRKASSRSGGTTSSPSGFATALATFARNFVRAIPTVTGMPTCSRTSRRSRTAISRGVPARRSMPRTSRKASSIEIPSTSGRRVLEDREERLARSRVLGHARRHDERLGQRRSACGPPSPCGRRRPSPRSSRPAPRRRRRSPASRAAAGRPAARPTRRTSPRQRGGSSPDTNRCSQSIAPPATSDSNSSRPAEPGDDDPS